MKTGLAAFWALVFCVCFGTLFAENAQAIPDLTPYKPHSWFDNIPIELSQLQWDEVHSYTGPFYSDQTLYFNWGSANYGDTDASGYTVRVEVTGGGGGLWEWTDTTTQVDYWTFLVSGQAVGPLSVGEHTFRLWIDYNGDVVESDEANNYYERTITVSFRDLGEISGSKWYDSNGNAQWDQGEQGLSNWRIYIDENMNGYWDEAEPNTLTDANGDYVFTNLPTDAYVIAEVLQDGWIQTYPEPMQPQAAMTGQTAYTDSPITTTDSEVAIFRLGEIVEPTQTQIIPSTAQSGELINMGNFRNDPRFSGIDGSGYSAVIIDTGIDLDHPFFGPDDNGDNVADRIIYHYDFANGDNNASDFHSHGSNVASIVVSEDPTYTGMAPGANLIALKVFTDSGEGNFGYVEQALQWVVDNALAYNIASVNMSLGDEENWMTAGSHYGIGDEIAALAALNVIVASAAGNSFYEYSGQQGISYPSSDPGSLSIGAVYDFVTGGWTYSGGAVAYSSGPDRIAPFSQRHSSLMTVFAPGAVITGANKNGGTVNMHGTSQASPHIAGIAVLAQQLAENILGRRLTLLEFGNLLDSTGVVINDGDDEDDNVANTGLDFRRVDMVALANGILAMGRTGSHIVVLMPGETVTGINFGNGPDCNNNEIVDAIEITGGAEDFNGNGIPDECEICPCVGDVTGDGWKAPDDVSGLVSLLLPAVSNYYWIPAPIGSCGDLNDDGWLSPDDVSGIVGVLLPHASSYYWVQCPQE